MKTHLFHGLIAGLLSSLASIIYLNVYQNLYFLDYSLAINSGSIIGSSIIGCVLMSVAYFLLEKMKKDKLIGVANILFVVLSFLSIIPVMTMSLPLEVEFPELFPGLVIPMHFFPALAFLSLNPFFSKE